VKDHDDSVTALLAAPTERVRAWYKALTGDSRLNVRSYSADLVDLQHKLETMTPEVLILDAGLFDGPDELRTTLESIRGVLVFLILPPQAGEEQVEFALSMPCVAGGWVGDVNLPGVAGEIHEAAMQARGASPLPSAPVVSFTPDPPAPAPADSAPSPSAPPPVAVPPPPPGEGRVVTFWSGPAGGTGCTTLALAFSALAAGRGLGTILLALSEPAVSTYLHLDRVPNIASFFTASEKRLEAATQRIGWGEQNERVGMHVMLGPARPRDGVIEPGQLSSVIEAARAAYPVVVVDVPSLPPGGNPWAMVPLQHATDVMLVEAPTVMGISATVEVLAILHELSLSSRVHLALNQRFPSGAFTSRDFRAGVEAVWRSCPDVTRVGFVQDLPGSMNGGEIPDSDILGDALESLGELAGLPAPSTSTNERAGGFSLGKLRIIMQA
jgi:MinD-like ATPase involved in chromosome partitioning or flagellar assembly